MKMMMKKKEMLIRVFSVEVQEEKRVLVVTVLEIPKPFLKKANQMSNLIIKKNKAKNLTVNLSLLLNKKIKIPRI